MKLEQLKKKRNTNEILAYGTVYPEFTDDRIHANINYSTILSRLIQEAGTQCQSYASDLFISWESMLNKISKQDEDGVVTEYFGFRDLGVDHETFIRIRLENEDIYGKEYYHSIFKVDTEIKDTNVTMKLVQLR